MSTFVICEAGVNMSGRLDTAIKLVEQAVLAKADAVKFQLFDPERLAPADHSTRAMLKGLAMTRTELKILHAETVRAGLEFMCTAFDVESLTWLITERMIKRIKIASGQMKDSHSNRELWAVAAASGLPIIMSCGMARNDEIEFVKHRVGHDHTLLYCISQYPTAQEDIDLSQMDLLRELHPSCEVGFSSHCPNFWPSVVAVYAGASVTENHMTLDRSAVGPDHTSSLLPLEFAAMVREIRRVDAERIL